MSALHRYINTLVFVYPDGERPTTNFVNSAEYLQYAYTYIHTYTHTHIHTHLHTYINTRMDAHVHMYICMHKTDKK